MIIISNVTDNFKPIENGLLAITIIMICVDGDSVHFKYIVIVIFRRTITFPIKCDNEIKIKKTNFNEMLRLTRMVRVKLNLENSASSVQPSWSKSSSSKSSS